MESGLFLILIAATRSCNALQSKSTNVADGVALSTSNNITSSTERSEIPDSHATPFTRSLSRVPLGDPDDESQLFTFVLPRELPTSKRRNINTDHHKGLVLLYPTVTRLVGKKDRRSRGTQPLPRDRQFWLTFSPCTIAFSPPKEFLSKSRVIRGVARQPSPCSLHGKFRP